MADHYNLYPMKHFAAMVAGCMEFPLPDAYAPPIGWALDILKRRLGGPADRAVLYHADAVGLHMWQKYTDLFAPVYRYTCMGLPILSTVESVTPVAHASMYTGLDPEEHGIQTYIRPKLTCDTLFDVLIRAGRKPAIISFPNATFMHIFAERALDYYPIHSMEEIQETALKLIASDKYDVISIHACVYDSVAHHNGPESQAALDALSGEAQIFGRIGELLEQTSAGHRTLLTYSPDHGQHPVAGDRGAHGSKLIEDMNVVQFYGTI